MKLLTGISLTAYECEDAREGAVPKKFLNENGEVHSAQKPELSGNRKHAQL